MPTPFPKKLTRQKYWPYTRACLINHTEAVAIYYNLELRNYKAALILTLLDLQCTYEVGLRIFLVEVSFILSLSLLPTSIFSAQTMVIFLDCYNNYCSITRVYCEKDFEDLSIRNIFHSVRKPCPLQVSFPQTVVIFLDCHECKN